MFHHFRTKFYSEHEVSEVLEQNFELVMVMTKHDLLTVSLPADGKNETRIHAA